jgi:hypothetical protein
MNINEQNLPNTTTENTTIAKTRSTGIMPRAQFDVLTLAENVLNKWANTPQITLLWTNTDEFKKLVIDYRNFLQERVEVGSNRGSQTQTLRDLDKQINKAVEEVKIGIMAKFGKEKGKAYFSEFGIVKQNSKFSIPTDRNLRINALSLLAKAVRNHSLQIAGFENTFFENILDDYTGAFQSAQQTDSVVSISVGNKNDLRRQIEEVITALHAVIKANYPKTFEGELRGWGFHKEKY